MMRAMEVTMSSLRTLVMLVVLAALLAACEVTITPTPLPTPSESITAQGVTIDPSSRGSVSVPAGTARWVEVTYPSNASADLMFFEVGNAAGIRVELYNAAGTVRQLVSRSASVFADRLDTLDGLTVSAATSAERSSIGIGFVCLGPCVATPYSASTRFVRLVNEGSTDRNVQLFAYGFQYDDLDEPNDTPGTARTYVADFEGDGPTGAIEHVADRDFHRINCGAGFPFADVQLTLSTTFPGDMVLRAAGNVYEPGEATPSLPCGSVVEVTTLDGTAAPAGDSTYSIVVD
jgi:hypothetical protein